MFFVTAKLPKKQLAAGAVALAALGLLLLSVGFAAHGIQTSAAAGETRVKTEEDRIAYLEGFGWTLSGESIAVEELLIPEQFDASYDDYLALQSGQGFDLTQYAGKRVKRYTYEVTNYPTGETGVQAALLIYKNTVIGGEVLSPATGGFLHGLDFPGAQ